MMWRRIRHFLFFCIWMAQANANVSPDTAARSSITSSPQFVEGKDYFTYRETLNIPHRQDGKIQIQFFFDYDCRVCSVASDILNLYTQIHRDNVALIETPVATDKSRFSAHVFFALKALEAEDVSEMLLFESAEKSRYTELSQIDRLLLWLNEQHINADDFLRLYDSPAIQQQVEESVRLTEEYGVFTFPFVIIEGQYVLTASTLYNDDYSFAVLDFLINKIRTENKK